MGDFHLSGRFKGVLLKVHSTNRKVKVGKVGFVVREKKVSVLVERGALRERGG